MKHRLQKGNSQMLVDSLGAELCSLVIEGKERLWSADAKWWPRHSPVLFPTIGRNKNDHIQVDGQVYPMTQHGFARDLEFELKPEKSSETVLHFSLYDSGETLQRFPFPFELHLVYTLLKNGVHVRYEVFNPGNRPLPFALGAHPAFFLPVTGFEGVYMDFMEEEHFERHLLNEGLFTGQTLSMGKGTRLPITQTDFDLDAIVFKNIPSRKIELIGPGLHLEMQFGGFQDLGIWTKKGCEEFLCLESWYGYADSVNGEEELIKRDGIHLLEAGKSFEAFWQVSFS
ncbi:MAG: aldose 1-epimerase family protein [Bacteroidia bacterium]